MRASDHVSFDGEYSTAHMSSEPAGKEIAEQLTDVLVKNDLKVRNSYKTDYSHGILVSVNGTTFYVEVGAVGDENAEWLAYFGFKFNFLGIKWLISGNEYDFLANALNDALRMIPRITNIRWYKNQHTWNRNSSNYTVGP